VQALVKDAKEQNVIFVDDRLNFSVFRNEAFNNLTGWLNIKGVRAVGPRIVEHDSKIAIDCGAIITLDGVRPIFYNSPPYHQTPIGNIEWVRNLKVISHLFFTVKTEMLSRAIDDVVLNGCIDEYVHTAIQLCLARGGRLVFNPKVSFELAHKSYVDQLEYYDNATSSLQKFLPEYDPYGNPNLSAEDPMRLAKIVQAENTEDEVNEIPSAYQQEALIHALNASLTHEEVQANYRYISKVHAEKISKIQHTLFILPGFRTIYAGLNNIFSYADFLRKRGIKISFALILDKKDIQKHIDILKETFPELAKSADFYPVTLNSTDKLPSSDVAICTQWATAYILAKYNKTKRKCYFIQDKETSFYPMGTISVLAENTYKMDFLKWYKNTYKGQGIVIKSKVDLSNYSPDKNKSVHAQKPYKVFFYARPNEPRNAFELGIVSLVKLKEKLKKDVEIYTAGAAWDPAEYGLDESMISLGKISFDKLPSFYRSMDIGLMFMFSGHPGVVASELMASGCPVVVNQYNDVTWDELYQHEESCLVAISTASSIAESLERGLIDDRLRGAIIPNALKKVEKFYGHYNESCRRSIELLKKPLDDNYEN
jgi:glycosyltransferase involved in cell wall biosynthesis